MPPEIEAKIQVKDFAAVSRELRRTGAMFLHTVRMTDVYYDDRGGTLVRLDCGLRIRSCVVVGRAGLPAEKRKLESKVLQGPAAPPCVLTFKGPRRAGTKYKTRPEIEVAIDDAWKIAGILENLGFNPSLAIRKTRSSYLLGRCRVELDDVPLLGRYVEVEGPNPRAIAAVCKRLGLTGPTIVKGYTHLLVDYCRRKRRKSLHNF